jgi:hypothetical protein
VQPGAIPDQGESISTHPIGSGLYYGESNGGRQRGIHRVTASLEHIEAGLSGQWLAGSHRPMGRKDWLVLPRKYQVLEIGV